MSSYKYIISNPSHNNTVILTFNSTILEENIKQVEKELKEILEDDFDFHIIKLDTNTELTTYLLKLLISFYRSIEKENLIAGILCTEKHQNFLQSLGLNNCFIIGNNREKILHEMTQI